MTYSGRVENGVVILDNGAELADGTRVRVEPVTTASPAAGSGHAKLLKLAGVIDDLPADFARNHDHYLHGQPKQ